MKEIRIKYCLQERMPEMVSLILSAGYQDMPMLMTGAGAMVTKDVETKVGGGVHARVIGRK